MNAELEAHLVAVRNAPAVPEADTEARRREREDFAGRFLQILDSTLKSVLDSAATTLQKHGYGATVELVRERSGGDPNSFPYVTLYFSPRRCPGADLGYLYTLAGASVGFICRRNDLRIEVLVAHPAGRGVERRVSFNTVGLEELTPDRVMRVVTDAVKQIIKG
jgi:hypothetical protein